MVQPLAEDGQRLGRHGAQRRRRQRGELFVGQGSELRGAELRALGGGQRGKLREAEPGQPLQR